MRTFFSHRSNELFATCGILIVGSMASMLVWSAIGEGPSVRAGNCYYYSAYHAAPNKSWSERRYEAVLAVKKYHYLIQELIVGPNDRVVVSAPTYVEREVFDNNNDFRERVPCKFVPGVLTTGN